MPKKTVRCIILATIAAFLAACSHSVPPPLPYGPCPTPQQVEWQRMEMNMFCHFGPNTFTGLEWGNGNESEALFNPTALDCRQWVTVAQQGGMGGIIITAKHHDGFCLWPTPYSSHTVSQSPWRDGRGDVLKELRDAIDENKSQLPTLKMGIYISPWDRNAPTYGTPEYNETFRLTLEDALSRYGDIFEQWFDGANGEGPNGRKQDYDWTLFNSTVARIQPRAVIFSDVGPGCRWIGNEEGRAGETCWSTLDIEGFTPGAGSPHPDTLNQGNRPTATLYWVPAEADVSIRPGWFYHDNETPKTLQQLLEIYYNSVGRNALLLLNVPPDRRGLISSADSARVVELRQTLDSIFSTNLACHARTEASHIRGGRRCRTFRPENVLDDDYHTYWAVDDSVLSPTLTLTFDEQTVFNRVMLQEYIPLGQRVAALTVEYLSTDGTWHPLAKATTIGYKRILLTPTVTAKAIRISIDEALACPVINHVGVYLDKWLR
ncbi:MAG: alpha-L-fucosidase [Bacteroidales bacterium]|nr:alpha-L-fucosidase [Bacteroidales bacterium]